MAAAHKCDMLGTVAEGAGAKSVEVMLHDGFKLIVTPVVKVGAAFVQAELGAEAQKLIADALATLADAAKEAADGKKE